MSGDKVDPVEVMPLSAEEEARYRKILAGRRDRNGLDWTDRDIAALLATLDAARRGRDQERANRIEQVRRKRVTKAHLDAARTDTFDEADNMCPNCVTPWKCNGPHLAEQTVAAKRSTLDAARSGDGGIDVAGRIEELETALNDGAIGAMRYAARRLDAIEGERTTATDLRADADKLEAILLRATPSPSQSEDT